MSRKYKDAAHMRKKRRLEASSPSEPPKLIDMDEEYFRQNLPVQLDFLPPPLQSASLTDRVIPSRGRQPVLNYDQPTDQRFRPSEEYAYHLLHQYLNVHTADEDDSYYIGDTTFTQYANPGLYDSASETENYRTDVLNTILQTRFGVGYDMVGPGIGRHIVSYLGAPPTPSFDHYHIPMHTAEEIDGQLRADRAYLESTMTPEDVQAFRHLLDANDSSTKQTILGVHNPEVYYDYGYATIPRYSHEELVTLTDAHKQAILTHPMDPNDPHAQFSRASLLASEEEAFYNRMASETDPQYPGKTRQYASNEETDLMESRYRDRVAHIMELAWGQKPANAHIDGVMKYLLRPQWVYPEETEVVDDVRAYRKLLASPSNYTEPRTLQQFIARSNMDPDAWYLNPQYPPLDEPLLNKIAAAHKVAKKEKKKRMKTQNIPSILANPEQETIARRERVAQKLTRKK